MLRLAHVIAPVLCVLWLGGCAQFESKRGVDVNWQSVVTEKIEVGRTTRKDILALLGPPSQVIALDNESVLYYLFEHSEGEGVILIVYNRMRIDTKYDRAIFFFDENDVLTDFSTRVYPTDET